MKVQQQNYLNTVENKSGESSIGFGVLTAKVCYSIKVCGHLGVTVGNILKILGSFGFFTISKNF